MLNSIIFWLNLSFRKSSHVLCRLMVEQKADVTIDHAFVHGEKCSKNIVECAIVCLISEGFPKEDFSTAFR